MTRPIRDYAFLSDSGSLALVAKNGSIDWFCTPQFDTHPALAAILDPRGGHFKIEPAGDYEVSRRYVDNSLVLETTFTTASGSVRLTDGISIRVQAGSKTGRLQSDGHLFRIVEGIRGSAVLNLDYETQAPELAATDGKMPTLRLQTPANVSEKDSFEIIAGQRLEFVLGDDRLGEVTDAQSLLRQTVNAWSEWNAKNMLADSEVANRNAAIIQGLTFEDTSALIAAATTSLPEEMGGESNWDYRFGWLRDIALTVRAQNIATRSDTTARLFNWLVECLSPLDGESVQIMFAIKNDENLPERNVDEWAGYANSKPVRFGNAAFDQRQLDVKGEVLGAAYLLHDELTPFSDETKTLLIGLTNRAADHWSRPDSGMWEARDKERHYTSSKVMCWVALDRGLKMADDLGVDDATVEKWKKSANDVRNAVLEQAWIEKIDAFGGAFESDHLDASVLLMPLVGFLPFEDERVQKTIHLIDDELAQDGLVARWKGDTGGFIVCSFWLVECLAEIGEIEKAERYYNRIVACANDVGVMSEMVDFETGDALGNTPQTLSHIGWINAAETLHRAKRAKAKN